MCKSSGIDEIPNEEIMNLGTTAETKLLHIFNNCWTVGSVLQTWTEVNC